MTDNGNYSNEPRPRLCHLRRWPDFVGYGFNLHCEKSKPGQYIGKVDADSPAESAGLRENDRIIEVNYVPIGNENHKQVVSRIKEGVTRNNTKYPEEVILLVLDPEADSFFKTKSIIVRGTDANVEKRESEPHEHGKKNGNISPQSSNKSVGKTDSPIVGETSSRTKLNETNREYIHVTDFTGPTVTHTKTSGSPPTSRTSQPDPVEERVPVYSQPSPPSSGQPKRKEFNSSGYDERNSPTKVPPKDFYVKSVVSTAGVEVPRSSSPQSSRANGGTGNALDFKMSAAEYREMLKNRNARKRDPRQDQQMSMREKHDLIDRL